MNKLKALLVVLLVCLGMYLNASPKTTDWSFTQQNYEMLTDSQKHIIKTSYWVGKPYDLGHTLAAISIVETRAGGFPDTTVNRICGVHQVDVYTVQKNMKTKTHPKQLCRVLQDSPVISAIESLKILLYWRSNSKSYRGMIAKYNRGWYKVPYDAEYYRRMAMVLRVLSQNDLEKL